MPLTRLDHVNIRTHRLDAMIRFYCDVVGLHNGDRPPFSFGGAWLYCGDQAAVHFVELTDKQPGNNEGAGRIDHFAFMASDLRGFIARLESGGIDHAIRTIPELGNTQVNVRDPDGNRVEIQFPADESI
jgi:catechol 2,3-dioxygenase-like lactoylglutathione lyase family enzyme